MAYRSATNLLGAGGTTSAAVPVPSGAAADDIAVVGLYVENTATISPPSGFTQKVDLQTGAPGSVGRLTIFWKRLTAGDTGTWDFTWTGAAYKMGVAALFSGRVTTGDPFESSSTSENTTGQTITCAALSPAAAGDDLVGAAESINEGAWTAPSGMTDRSGTGQGINLTSADNVASGTTGTKTTTCGTSGNHGMKAFLGALLPVSTAPALPIIVLAPRRP